MGGLHLRLISRGASSSAPLMKKRSMHGGGRGGGEGSAGIGPGAHSARGAARACAAPGRAASRRHGRRPPQARRAKFEEVSIDRDKAKLLSFTAVHCGANGPLSETRALARTQCRIIQCRTHSHVERVFGLSEAVPERVPGSGV
eukprot:scaffold102175_cov63-Phaeocystis_antarctica.AAC.4